MEIEFSAEAISWRGPAPFVFVPVPAEEADLIAQRAAELTYGWGAIPVRARIGRTDFTTSLFPRDGTYLVPVKLAVQRAEEVEVGDVVKVHLRLGAERA